MIDTFDLINKSYTLQHVRGDQELIVANDLEELDHITNIYADGGYTLRGRLSIFEGKIYANIINSIYILGDDKETVIGFN